MKKILACTLFVTLLFSSVQAAEIMTTRNLSRGTVIAPTDIAINSANYDIAGNYIGMQLKRTVYQGQVLHLSDLAKPVLVKRNAIVSMSYGSGALLITTSGRSLGEGAAGDIIQVMNGQSRKKVQAVITGPDRVRVQ